jgi:hypothetical protein
VGRAEQTLEGVAQLIEWSLDACLSGDHENVEAGSLDMLGVTQDLADATADAVSIDSAAQPPCGRDSEAVVIAGIWNEADDHEPVGPGAAARSDAREVLPGPKCRHGAPSGGPGVRR